MNLSASESIFSKGQELQRVYSGGVLVWEKQIVPTNSFYIKTTKQISFAILFRTTAISKVVINWGDGSTTLINSLNTTYYKTYASAGEYTITLSGELFHVTQIKCNNQELTEFSMGEDLFNLTSIDLSSNALMTGEVLLPASYTKLTSISFGYTAITKFECLGVLPQYDNLLINFQSCPNLQTFAANNVVVAGDIYVRNSPSLVIFEMQNLHTFKWVSADNTALTAINLPSAVQSMTGTGLHINSNPYIQIINIPNIIATRSLACNDCPMLTTINTNSSLYIDSSITMRNSDNAHPVIPSSTKKGLGSFDYRNMGLTVSEVDAVLAAFKSVTLNDGSGKPYIYLTNLSGASGAVNASPSQAGKSDATWLRNNGWNVAYQT